MDNEKTVVGTSGASLNLLPPPTVKRSLLGRIFSHPLHIVSDGGIILGVAEIIYGVVKKQVFSEATGAGTVILCTIIHVGISCVAPRRKLEDNLDQIHEERKEITVETKKLDDIENKEDIQIENQTKNLDHFEVIVDTMGKNQNITEKDRKEDLQEQHQMLEEMKKLRLEIEENKKQLQLQEAKHKEEIFQIYKKFQQSTSQLFKEANIVHDSEIILSKDVQIFSGEVGKLDKEEKLLEKDVENLNIGNFELNKIHQIMLEDMQKISEAYKKKNEESLLLQKKVELMSQKNKEMEEEALKLKNLGIEVLQEISNKKREWDNLIEEKKKEFQELTKSIQELKKEKKQLEKNTQNKN